MHELKDFGFQTVAPTLLCLIVLVLHGPCRLKVALVQLRVCVCVCVCVCVREREREREREAV